MESGLLPGLLPLLWLFQPSEEEDGPTLALPPGSQLWVPSYSGAQTALNKMLLTVRLAMHPRKRNFSSAFSGVWFFQLILLFNIQSGTGSGCLEQLCWLHPRGFGRPD